MDNSPKMEAAVDAVFEMLSQWSDKKFFKELQGSYDGGFAHLLKGAGVLDPDSAFDLEAVEHVEHIEIYSYEVSNCYVPISYKDKESIIHYQKIGSRIDAVKKDDEVFFDSILGEFTSSWMTKIA